jgi:hypothetical protein
MRVVRFGGLPGAQRLRRGARQSQRCQNVRDGSKTEIAPRSPDFRSSPNRWGNRPALLWISEELGCCASG